MAKSKKKIQTNRTPIVAILGHVDHGKTTILDKIRETTVQLKEVGGITQKISVFTVDTTGDQSKMITFIDTPGHEAFDLMRLRGGSIADIVLLIVAADDGVKPQTEESIEIVKNSPAKPIVVINKVDLPNISVEKVKREISTKGLELEGFGGDIPVVEVSGETGQGIDQLLETISTVAEVEGLLDRGKLAANATAKGYVLESIKDKSKGHVASIVSVQGEFKKGDWLVYLQDNEVMQEKIRGFVTEDQRNIEMFSEGHGGKILGLSAAIDLGTEVFVIEKNDKKVVKELFKDAEKIEEEAVTVSALDSVDPDDEEAVANALLTDLFAQVKVEEDEKKKLNVIVKSSSEGSLEAIRKSLEKLDIEGHVVNMTSTSIGDVSANDVNSADITKSILLAFEVGVSSDALSMAKDKRVLLRQYDIIYKLVDEVKDALTLMATPQETEEELGEADVRAIFILTNGSKVVGGRVKSGIIKKNARCYIVRDDEIVGEGKITSLKHGKNEVNEAAKGGDFGVVITPEVDAQEGDLIHCFKVVKMTI